jgi:hypothetical protein
LARIRKLRLRQDEAFSDIIAEGVVEGPLAAAPTGGLVAGVLPAAEKPLESAEIPPTVTA